MPALTRFLHAAPRPFVLLDAIDRVHAHGLRGIRHFQGAPFWQLWEAGAQCAALHQRQACGFRRHAFLLGMSHCPLDARRANLPDGRVLLTARREGQSSRAALYTLHCTFPDCPGYNLPGETGAAWEVRIGLVDYDARFRQELLQPRYEEIFACLCQQAACMPD